jgi:hypothetical protein
MLSAMTPLAERGRGHRFGATAAWFLAGAVAGGVTLGMGAGALAGVVGVLDVSTAAAASIAASAALVCAASDARVGGFELPRHDRQVNEDWFAAYRRWAYASGFGWQISVGLATYITTAAVYLMIAVAVLTGDALIALALCVVFGLVRGLAIFLARPLVTIEAVQGLHRRFHAWAQPSRWATVVAQTVLAVAFAAIAGAPVLIAVAAAALVAAVVTSLQLRRGAESPTVDQRSTAPAGS